MSDEPKPRCAVCGKRPDQLLEYVEAAEQEDMLPDDYVRKNEGTYNAMNGFFLCTEDYIKAGQPASEQGWTAPEPGGHTFEDAPAEPEPLIEERETE